MGRVIDVQAPEFAAVRLTLGLSQGAFAARLGISRRTAIRGEQRGIELPSRYGMQSGTPARRALLETWEAARKQAQADPRYLEIAAGDTIAKILGKMSQVKQNPYSYATESPKDWWRGHVATVRELATPKTRAGVSQVTLSRRRPAAKAKSRKPKKLARSKRR
jgi:hypothetical protein